jgi:hypothetical protein
MEEYPGIEDANCMLVYGYIDKEAGMTLEVLAAGQQRGDKYRFFDGSKDSRFFIRIGAVEDFEIDGIYFEYTDNEIMNGYNTTSSHGGVVTQDGQYLKIKYIVSEYESGESRNIILYIAEIDKSNKELYQNYSH